MERSTFLRLGGLCSIFVLTSGDAFHPSPILNPVWNLECKNYTCTDKNCLEFPNRECKTHPGCPFKTCLHKHLLPVFWVDYVLFCLIFVVAIVASMAGIGGSSIAVPLLTQLTKFNLQEAVPISQLIVLGNTFAQVIVNHTKKHPETRQRSLIDFDLGILILPVLLAGRSFSLVIGPVLPPNVLVIVSLVLFLIAIVGTSQVGIRMARRNELARMRSRMLRSGVDVYAGINMSVSALQCRSRTEAGSPQLFARPGGLVRTWSGTALNAIPAPGFSRGEVLPSFVSSVEEVSSASAWKHILCLIVVTILFSVDHIFLLIPSVHIKGCSWRYWCVLLVPLPFACCVYGVGFRQNRHRSDVIVRGLNLAAIFPTVLIAGAVGALVGVDGGELVTSLLLVLGLEPHVSAATSGCVVFLSTSAAISYYLAVGAFDVSYGYSVAVMILAFSGALLGLCLRELVPISIAVFLLVAVLVASTVLLTYRSFFLAPHNWTFGQHFCTHQMEVMATFGP